MQDLLFIMIGLGLGVIISEWRLNSALNNEGIRRVEYDVLKRHVLDLDLRVDDLEEDRDEF